jgi:MFS family permease
MVPSFAWYFVAEGRYGFLFILFATGGIFGGGFLLGHFGLLLKLVPAEAKTTAISLNAAITATMAFIAPIIGGFLLEQAWAAGWDKAVVYPWVSVLHHVLVLLTALILLRIEEPRSAELSQVVGAMRSTRQIAAILGIGTFLNYFFFRRPGDRP